jgi:hypothetical protein
MPWTHRGFWLLPLLIGGILAIVSALVARTRLRRIYKERFQSRSQEQLFLAAVGFFTAVLVVRGVTIAIHYDIGPFHDVEMHGRHIHHLVWGILLLLSMGYLRLIETEKRWVKNIESMLFGVGAALTLDEFALWLNLRDVYWLREGRESFEAMALFGGLLAIGLFGGSFFGGIAREAGRVLGRKPAR